ncbi:MAG TPA: glutamate-5-semialdehyde dehydrogenase [Thermoleophilaceae bacterium]|nr:glutamate-5-semialdehyde dehydrogenase [Thermoleophilaceae bacterium]
MATTAMSVSDVCAAAKLAARELAATPREARDAALRGIADALDARSSEILEANARDVRAGEEAGLGDALIDRLTLNEDRLAAIARDVRRIAELDDPIGEVIERRTLDSGLEMTRVRVPLGVVAIVYEARPNVTIDAAALTLKSGNAVVLRGSSSAAHSNAALAAVAQEAVAAAGLPREALSILTSGDRDELRELATQEGVVDLIIPRGGEGLKKALKDVATVPIIYAASGNCHVYVDADADLEMAREIAVNAKVNRPGTCNSAEKLLVHADVAPAFLPDVLGALLDEGVELRADARTRALAGPLADRLRDAGEEDWPTEYLAMVMAVKVVDSLDEAIDHVNTHGSGHSEAIVTRSDEAAHAFTARVDSACVYVNASTRFTDGAEFGLGAEMGNSTQKLHARGPVALRELTTYKYVLHGSGQVRS